VIIVEDYLGVTMKTATIDTGMAKVVKTMGKRGNTFAR